MREHNENRSTNKTEKEMCAYASPDSALSSALSRSASTMANLRATYWGRENEEARIKRSIEEEGELKKSTQGGEGNLEKDGG